MKKISVIIPVYNAHDYLRRCLDSVCNQTLKDIEIICVDDCSTDDSLAILNEYATKYPQMKVIVHQTNGGESKARNTGIDAATGEYLSFVDNDDVVDLDFYEKLYNKAKQEDADICKGEVHSINYDQKEIWGELNKKIKEQKSSLFFIYHWWTAIYRMSMIQKNNIRLPEGYPLGGDVLFLNEAVLCANKVALVDDVFYHYYRRENSGDSKVLTFEKVKSVLDIHEQIVDNVLKSSKLNTFSKAGVENIFVWCLNAALVYCFRCKNMNVLDYSIQKAFSIYPKVASFISSENTLIYPVCMNILSNGNEQDLKNFFMENDTQQKMIIANLRYKNGQRIKNEK